MRRGEGREGDMKSWREGRNEREREIEEYSHVPVKEG